jgi:seryl-tRNA synthetase
MFRFTEPEESMKALDEMTADAEDICNRLGFQYRVLLQCTGDLGFSAVKTYDIELWAPGSQDWLEVSSVSNCTDFQARRAKIRYRAEQGGRPQLLHTLNGSGLGIPRTLIAILESNQQADGSIVVPEVLRRYTGFERIEVDEKNVKRKT